MNAMVVGSPTGDAGALAAALMTGHAGGPVTLVSDDAAELLAALERPGLSGAEVLCVEPGSPASCDDALVHRQLLHGAPAGLAVVADAPGDSGCRLGVEMLRRLPGVPFVVTGGAAGDGRWLIDALAPGPDQDEADGQLWDVLPGTDPRSVVRRLSELAAGAAARPVPAGAGMLGHGHCIH